MCLPGLEKVLGGKYGTAILTGGTSLLADKALKAAGAPSSVRNILSGTPSKAIAGAFDAVGLKSLGKQLNPTAPLSHLVKGKPNDLIFKKLMPAAPSAGGPQRLGDEFSDEPGGLLSKKRGK